MKNLGKVLSFGALLAAGSFAGALAQEDNSRGYNPNSVRPIHESDIMFKRTVWRRMDLNEKQNKPFFALNSEITRVIINAAKAGLLQPYTKDSLTEKMTLEKFNENLKTPTAAPELDATEKAVAATEDAWSTPTGSAPGAPVAAVGYEFLPQELKTLEIKEDLIFDKQRSRQYWDIQSITIVIPGEKFESGLDKAVASFKYKDLVKIFRNDPKAIYFNTQNNREHKNLADAFDLRLHHARIIKVSNADDAFLSDIYEGGRQGLLASEQLEQQLMEFEHNLWEF
ncbi:MAG: gliding motility protein GldN [Ferruginibacter sp.]|nr:gliding motility protein GldN [Cytophagales bacterium]